MEEPLDEFEGFFISMRKEFEQKERLSLGMSKKEYKEYLKQEETGRLAEYKTNSEIEKRHEWPFEDWQEEVVRVSREKYWHLHRDGKEMGMDSFPWTGFRIEYYNNFLSPERAAKECFLNPPV